jgi:preprotein translocase subunit SecE
MNSKLEVVKSEKGSNLQAVLWALIVLLIGAGVFANYYFSAVSWSIRLAGWIILACILVLIAFQTTAGKKFWAFAKEARVELYKVVWPTRKETTHTTLIITALVIFVAVLLWGIDTVLLVIINWLTGQRG